MATTTPNFGWPVPTSSDLVKNGATAIEGLGDAIDASLLDLKGGTTGQVLKKNSNTDMDFVWGADSAGMTNPMTTTGDTIYSSSGSTPARLGIGTTGQVLTVAGGLPSWATPAGGGGKVLQVVSAKYATQLNVGSTTVTDTGLTATITPTSATSTILVLVSQNGVGKGDSNCGARIQIVRGATNIAKIADLAGYDDSTGANYIGSVSGSYVDSPATTSATTYKTTLARNLISGAGGEVIVQHGSAESEIVLLEIGA